MQSRSLGLERALLALFVASGFAGLIYQAIWSHYLGLTLGHAAYAQTLVLAIFMGGMAVGAWLVSRRGIRWRRLILAYAVVEILIGLAGLAFHPLFLRYSEFSQASVYPALDAASAIRAWQWGSAALLIAPQSVLLGMTFPLMSGGYLRVAPKADGEILGGLYFTNSIGAAFGALFATFVLLPWIGMPGAMVFAGVVNLLVGLLAWQVSRKAGVAVAAGGAGEPPAGPAGPAGTGRGFFWMMIVAAGITGATSFVYEIGWVRMLNQSLGTTVHSFELMLSAFILGLAFGGLWIRRRSQSISNAVAYAGHAQIWMGVAALVSLPVFAQSFRWVGALMEVLPKTDFGYGLYGAGSATVALLVMFPAAFFAGMTLPLFTMALLRKGAGEASIGRVYAANTLGAILGVALAVHVLIPTLGLHLSLVFAAMVDIALGFLLLNWFAGLVPGRSFIVPAAASLLVLLVSLSFGRAEPKALASGVFRSGRATLADDVSVSYLRDGKTATIAVFGAQDWRAIATNGKPDAALITTPGVAPNPDEITMVLAAALPLALHPDPRRIGVIGWGSGLTTHTLLGSPEPEVVDSVEIEGAMIEGARLFGGRVGRAYSDPRSKIHVDDARTYFSTGKVRYDVIVSEPSNPWVSGVASLFTRQFYGFLSRHLEEDGLLVQWVQTYELEDALLASMLAALAEEFQHIDVYIANTSDVLLVASHEPLPSLRYPARAGSVLAAEMERIGLGSTADFQVRRIGGAELVRTLVRLAGVSPHSDFHPVIALEAPKSRFKQASARWLADLSKPGLPVLEMTDGRTPVHAGDALRVVPGSDLLVDAIKARRLRDLMVVGNVSGVQELDPELASAAMRLRELSAAPVPRADISEWMMAAWHVSEATLSAVAVEDSDELWITPSWVAAGQPAEVQAVLDAYRATAARDAAGMRSSATRALGLIGDAQGMAPLREQLFVMAQLGAIGEGDMQAVARFERDYGREVQVGRDARYAFVRAYLLAWADG